MQSLWSRAGQAHRCGCKICDTAASTLGRRVTTAATRPRKPTFAEVFTACYSSVFASAAVVDAIRKEDKRQELDRQLEEARRELAAAQLLRSQETERITESLNDNQPDLTRDQMSRLWDCLKENHINRPYMKEIQKPVTMRVSELIKRLQTELHDPPDDATMQAVRQTDYDSLERAIMAEELDPKIASRDLKTHQHLHNDSRTIVALVRQLLSRAEQHCISRRPSPSFYEARKLANDRRQTHTFPSFDPLLAIENRCSLNQRLRDIVSSPNLDLKEMVGRVCYNLLVSAHPPDMHTYNALIVAFDKAGLYYFSEALVFSFFYYRRIMPTPTTIIVVLHHYKNSGNFNLFVRALSRIVGLDEVTGFKLGRRHRIDIEERRMKQWLPGGDKTFADPWVYKNVPLSQPLVEEIIHGLLHFSLFDQAANVFLTCMNVKVPLSTRIIAQLFDECILAVDWRAAVCLVRGFTDCQYSQHSFPSLLIERGSSYLINRIRVLVDICGLSNYGRKPSKPMLANLGISSEKFDQFMQCLEVLTRADDTSALDMGSSNNLHANIELDQAARAARSRLIQIETLWKEQELVRRTVVSIKSKLLYPDLSTEFRASMALYIGESATQYSLELNLEAAELISQMPETKSSQRMLAACERLRSSLEQGSERTPGSATPDLMTRSHELPVEQHVDEEDLPRLETRERGIASLAKKGAPISVRWPDGVAGRLQAMPRRSISWAVPDGRRMYSGQSKGTLLR